MTILAFGIPGGPEWLIIFLVLLLIFGGRKLPELARAMGSSITQFKKGMKEEPRLLDEEEDASDEEAKPKDGA